MTDTFEKIIPMLRRFAFSLTGSPADADDLVQATFEKILKKGVPEDVEILKWAFKVCRNVWIDEYRSRKVRLNATHSPELQEQVSKEQEPQHEAQALLTQVNQAMDSLPSDQRSILSLVALQGMSYKDVAATMEVPVGTVMSRLSRARMTLLNMVNPLSHGEKA
ncbi:MULTISPECIES: RNA polymerase sigma factor [Alteromonadaceae]|uniref:RNA polymerase sigma factor n=1 Tax=Alteromonadaceae TaxID=72275 RepID=UPI001C093C51|nr:MULTISPECIES: RNA polymerase sigma factor [Aliiglaciecola]MBU2877700.1 RNA polymerase sigma factor [Aliiglaciecola lipolytica]MDO6713089.1 RNA polymerase sigma factor [Aliiglaciecola sp. 2_MG-2023]MDO6754145.1 RNA polymerase sigma factor [Aliiglaciecola sp. 1_MG-2023]